jgi:hypothetical protein
VKPNLVAQTKRFLKDWRRSSLSELVLYDFFPSLKGKNRAKTAMDDKRMIPAYLTFQISKLSLHNSTDCTEEQRTTSNL